MRFYINKKNYEINNFNTRDIIHTRNHIALESHCIKKQH